MWSSSARARCLAFASVNLGGTRGVPHGGAESVRGGLAQGELASVANRQLRRCDALIDERELVLGHAPVQRLVAQHVERVLLQLP